MLDKDLLQKAKSFKNKDEFFKFAKEQGFSLNDENLEKFFNKLSQNNELSEEELENVTGGCSSTYSDATFESLDIYPSEPHGQKKSYHPLITTIGNSCKLNPRGCTCHGCTYRRLRDLVINYCSARSKEYDPGK